MVFIVREIDYQTVSDAARTALFLILYDYCKGNVHRIASLLGINQKQVYTYHPSRKEAGKRFSVPSDKLLARIIEACMKIDPEETRRTLKLGIEKTSSLIVEKFSGLVKTISSREMKALELNAEYLGVSRLQLMENAGCAVAREVSSRFKPNDIKIVVYAGLGGNGGDGFVAARHLVGLGFKIDLVLAGKPNEIIDESARKNWEYIQISKNFINTHIVYDSSTIPKLESKVAIDALLGTGAKGELRPPILQLVREINQFSKFRIAVDLPTGLDADTGEVNGEAVKANLTVAFHRAKPGLLKADEYVGKLVVVDIGIPPEVEVYAGPGDVYLAAKPREPEAHKGDFGRLLVIGGSETFYGAPALAALAALRTGVDIAYVAAPRSAAQAIASMSPNLITIKLDGDHLNPRNVSSIKEFFSKATAVVLGPGSGLHRDTAETVRLLIQVVEKMGLPLLLDADALKSFAGFKHKVRVPFVLTPHAGEYKILTGEAPPKELDDRIEHVRKNAADLGATILLKGHIDVISDGITVKLNYTGNPGMTVGGTGDTLCGVAGTFLAQGFSPMEAAVAGAFINGAAGDFAQEERGYHLVPTDIIEMIPKVMDDPMSHKRMRKM